MVVDTSAIIAILLQEPEAERFGRALAHSQPCLMSAATLLEASMVIETRKGSEGGRDLDLLIYRSQIEVVAVDQEQAEVARAAWRRFGKGRHPAGLNLGDCFAYALAKVSGSPLLFKGDDFTKTDIAAA
jgi:ribonuclease VapC